MHTWGDQIPSNTSYPDHLKTLVLKVMVAWHEAGRCGVIIVSPEVAAMLDAAGGTKIHSDLPPMNGGEAAYIGSLYGIPLWVTTLQPPDEVYIAEAPGEATVAVIRVINSQITRVSVLDLIAKASADPNTD